MANSRTASIRVPTRLYMRIKELIEQGEYNSVTDFFITAARHEIERIEATKGSKKQDSGHK